MTHLPGTTWAPKNVMVHALDIPGKDDAEGWGKFGVWIGLHLGDRDWEMLDDVNGIMIREDVFDDTLEVEVFTGDFVVFYPDGTIDIMPPEKFHLLYRTTEQ